MPKRTDIQRILVIGSGPIVIGQACEFDYSGTQACRALREEGYFVILVNSNPATIMTDPETSDRTYIEPITVESVTRIIEMEKPDALLPTLGGQTSLNMAVALAEAGVLEKYNVELIGAKLGTIKVAEDRELFRQAMLEIGLKTPEGGVVKNFAEADALREHIGLPLIIRPSFTLGGIGGSVVYNREEFEQAVKWGLEASPVHEVLIERSVLGWKEIEMETMRDKDDNFVIVCSIENFDAMGIHTGDSITVAPAQTLTDPEVQLLRDASHKIITKVGVETGGANVQFAINPQNGDMVVIEMNPRVSRSSALASKATGFPIAKIAAKLAVGYRLDELPNDITKKTPASFEPTIDYVVVKVPRWDFEKFPGNDATLTSQMKSVGETMGLGRTFKESLNKTLRSLENGWIGFCSLDDHKTMTKEDLLADLRKGTADRVLKIHRAFEVGISPQTVSEITSVDIWFIQNLYQLYELECKIREEYKEKTAISAHTLRRAKQYGFSDDQLAQIMDITSMDVRKLRKSQNILPSFKIVDTCAAEFISYTPYYYSSYDEENESVPSDRRKVIILGGGPNRIGQGIEFDYCCVHGVMSLREQDIEAIMINCNPETVSTDYDTADKLYFEPLTLENVLDIIDVEKPEGVVIQFGGQTPLKLALSLEKAGVKIWGTSPDSIDLAEDRDRFSALLESLGVPHPRYGTAISVDEAVEVAQNIGFPLVVRPSYVLGGRAMEIVYDMDSLKLYMKNATAVSNDHPVLLDRFLEDAYEFDVDALSDGEDCQICGIMQQIEEAGVHSGDSMAVLPPYKLSSEQMADLKEYTRQMAKALNVVGLLNIQFAIMFDTIYMLEVNPRASRTVPFISKAIGLPIAKMAVEIMAGKKVKDLPSRSVEDLKYVAVKGSVFPFDRFDHADVFLRPEMRSTGEVMGISKYFGEAVYKAFESMGLCVPEKDDRTVFISVNDNDKARVVPIAEGLYRLGFTVCATEGTALFFNTRGIPTKTVLKAREGRPNIVDEIKDGNISLIINTPLGQKSREDEYSIGRTAIKYKVPFITTLSAAEAILRGLKARKKGTFVYKCLQDYYENK